MTPGISHTITRTGTGKKHPGRFLVYMFLVLISQGLYATEKPESIPGDTDEVAQQQYDINDPRNPNCPCHQWQKKADEEYQRNQQHQNNPVVQDDANNANQDADTDNNRTQDDSKDKSRDDSNRQTNSQQSQTSSGSGGGSSHVKRGVDMPHLAIGKKTKKVLRRMGRKRNGTKKTRRSIVDCFHWG